MPLSNMKCIKKSTVNHHFFIILLMIDFFVFDCLSWQFKFEMLY